MTAIDLRVVIFFLALTYHPLFTTGSRILAVEFTTSQSHSISYEVLLEKLAERGHDVTIVSPYPRHSPGIRYIPAITGDELIARFPNLMKIKVSNGSFFNAGIPQVIRDICLDTLELPHLQKVRATEKFDLVLIPQMMSECALAWASGFDASQVIVSPVGLLPVPGGYMGNPSPSSFVPNFITTYIDTMTFYQRVINFLADSFLTLLNTYYILPMMEVAYRSKLGQHTPSVDQLYKNVSLVLLNGRYSGAQPRPLLPDIVEVGGMHLRPARPLPKDLEDFVNSSGDNGFIYFSLGSFNKGILMPEEKRKVFLEVFSRLKQKVLWKWESESMENLPPNVKLSKWLPQQDVLGHPKLRAFITHGGLGSIGEATYHGVPLIGIPIFGDQMANLKMAEKKGFAVSIGFDIVAEHNLYEGIQQVLDDARFKTRVSELSAILRDQPDHPLDRAVYWTEYVIRHKGAPHLRSAARELSTIQYYSIDVILLLGTVVGLALWLMFVLTRFLVRAGYSLVSAKCKSEWRKKKEQ